MKKRIQLIASAIFVSILIIIAGICLFLPVSLSRLDVSSDYRRIAIIFKQSGSIFWDEVRAGLQQEAQGKPLLISEYSYNHREEITSLLEFAAGAQTQGIILTAPAEIDDEFLKLLEQTRQEDIRVVFVDSRVDKTEGSGFVGADNRQCGTALAQAVLSSMQEEQTLLVLDNYFPSQSIQIRRDTFLEETASIEAEGRILMRKLLYTDAEQVNAIQQLLSSEECPDQIVCFSPEVTLTVANLLEVLGLDTDVQLFGVGEDVALIEYLQRRTISTLMIQDRREMGRTALNFMMELIDEPHPTEDEILLPIIPITPEDIESNEIVKNIMENSEE